MGDGLKMGQGESRSCNNKKMQALEAVIPLGQIVNPCKLDLFIHRMNRSQCSLHATITRTQSAKWVLMGSPWGPPQLLQGAIWSPRLVLRRANKAITACGGMPVPIATFLRPQEALTTALLSCRGAGTTQFLTLGSVESASGRAEGISVRHKQ